MAASNPQWHGRSAKVPSPPGPTSPLSPAGASNNPISFRTNVNRAKTKRWVEAKQYSYDGGEWGDEDEEDEKPQEAPQPPDATHRRGSSELSSRRLSDLALGSDGSRASPSAEAQSNPGGGDQKVLPFIRPADIYKRMREERSSVDSGRSTEAPQSSEQPGSTPTPAVASYPEASKAGGFNSSATTNNAPIMGLPELKRISAFGTDFLDGGDSNVQQNANPASLQHNPSQGSSQGFRSMVHQAFDAPETPNSTAGSVERSNSDGTSTVSSVMGNRGWYDYKTPTIFEDPAESTSPTAMAEAPEFKPDHRRDTSLPEGGNSPSKRPVVTEQILPASSYADVSTASPPVHHDDQSEEQAPPSAERDFVAPLKFGSSGNATAEGYRGDVSTIVPNAENSPQDADSERLREEIIRSLSRPSSQEAEELQVQAAKEELIPHQYENQRGDGQTQSGPNLEETPRALVSESHPDWTGSHPLSQDPYEAGQAGQDPAEEAAPASSGAPTRPRMSRRFSWESSSSNGDPASQAPGDITAPPPLSAALASQEPEPIPGAGTESVLKALSGEAEIADSEISDDEKVEKPRLSIVPPVADGSPPQQIRGPVDGGQRDPLLATVGSADIDESKLQGFREILTITIPEERIRAFNRIRDQFAAMNTGLNHWIEFTVHDHPDHADLIQSSQGLSADVPRSSPTTRRFPKLTSFGNLAARDDNAPANADHNRRPSGHMGTKVVEQRGKEFLHTAGTFSGKAGEAAKGLFAKGRSKFRPSGDKVSSMSPRKSLQFQFSFPSQSNASSDNFSRHSISLRNFSIFRSGRNESSIAVRTDSKDPSIPEDPVNTGRAGKRFRSSGSFDLLRSQFLGGEKDSSRRKSFGVWGKPDAASNLEQETNDARGHSPTDIRPQPRDDELVSTGNSQLPATREKSLPALPGGSDVAGMPGRPGLETSNTASSIRPVTNDAVKPSTPLGDVPPEVPPKDSPRGLLSSNLGFASSHLNHAHRQPSVSTLGVDEQLASRPMEEVESPPSPIQSGTNEAGASVYLKTLPEASGESATSLVSADEHAPQCTAVYARRKSSAQLLETPRRRFSGIPGTQSPLRNEVQYSPETRPSIWSWSSFGRRDSMRRRPSTPLNVISQRAAESNAPVPDGDSKMDKLKSFSRRRRESVGDLFVGIQENIQDGIQGLPETSKRKRTFSRLSGLFNGSHESSPTKTDGPSSSFKVLPPRQSTSYAQSSLAHSGQYNGSRHFTEKTLPAMPALDSQPVSEEPAPHDLHDRASMAVPPSDSPNAIKSDRFETPSKPEVSSGIQHTRAQSGPTTLAPALSATAPSTPDKHGSASDHRQGTEMTESQNQEEDNEEILVLPSPTLNPNLHSLKSTSTQPDTTHSTHPHRGKEVRSANETTEPVELAMKDDGSEEIVMSSTTYPGQEWTPMHM